jgi:hypothetical protein
MSNELLTRDQFREAVFARDSHKCVICKKEGQDAHHIIERRLFPDGGYFLSNGATLCGEHHLQAEATILSCEEIRSACGIDGTNPCLPAHLYPDQSYDKWGNPLLDNGRRLCGELFYDASVQKVLSPVLHLFTKHVKYPRTSHLPWSPGFTDDDRFLSEETLNGWANREIVITEKVDGENTTLYNNYIHARSLDFESRYDRDRIKAFHAQIGYSIPENWRICGENLTATHAIKYEDLPHFFLVFSIWERDTCLGWDDTTLFAEVLGLKTVPVLGRGLFRAVKHEEIAERMNFEKQEGYVIRPADKFSMREFPYVVGKYVRAGHVADSHVHWTRRMIEWNGWREE